MKIIRTKQYLEEMQTKKAIVDSTVDSVVLDIIKHVQTKGDAALFSYTKQFDGVEINDLLVQPEEIDYALAVVDPALISSLEQAKTQIITYHEAQKEQSWFMNKPGGIMLGQKVTPIERVGMYVPGGKAVYPSSVLMNALPAKIANVPSIIMTTPPNQDGTIHPNVLVAAHIAGVDQIYKVGGAQAIAALAYGTNSIQKVNKIVGPGNEFVARAKKWVFGDVAIDMIAGPSEICIIADEKANPTYIAADLLSQAEHDENAVTICITPSSSLSVRIQDEVIRQTKEAKRKGIIQTSIENNGRIIVTSTLEEAFDLANLIAPEHLQLMTEHAAEHVHAINNAGAIFIGSYAPEALGDYMAGPNHTLPTSGTALFASPLGVYDFVKKSSIIHYTKEALLNIADDIITIAEHEQLFAHAQSIQLRKDEEND